MADSAKIALAMLSLVEIPGVFNSYLPTLEEVNHQTSDEDCYWVRRNELTATVFSLASATAASILAGSAVPFFIAVAMCGLMIWLYEHALQYGIGPKQFVGDDSLRDDA